MAKIVDMKQAPVIRIWDECDDSLVYAIGRFNDCWLAYSSVSRGTRIDRLIQEIIDPAIAGYAKKLPASHWAYLIGAGADASLSDIIRLTTLQSAARIQHHLLRAFVATQAGSSVVDKRFIATLETLLDLIRSCARKRPQSSQLRDSNGKARGLDGNRPKELCRFCGRSSELADFAANEEQSRGSEDDLRLSSLYCEKHRPKLQNGEWNPEYRKAKRSIAQFDLELSRLTRQSGNWRKVEAQSGDAIVDGYIYHFVRTHNLRPGDEGELRDHARYLTDLKLTDRKKQMIMLTKYGVSQSEAARKLGVQRQAVFKALAGVPKEFRQLQTFPIFPAYFLK